MKRPPVCIGAFWCLLTLGRSLSDQGSYCWFQPSVYSSIWVDLGHLNESSLIVVQLSTRKVSEVIHMCHAERRRWLLFLREPIRRSSDILFDKRVYNKWSFEELPLVQRIRSYLLSCDTAVGTGTSGTDAVRTQCIHTPGQPVTHPPGFVSCSFTYSCSTLTLRKPPIIP